MNIANGRLSQRRFYQSHISTAQHFLVGSMAKNCRSHTNSCSSGTHALQEHVPSQESTLTCWEFIQALIFFSSKGHLKKMHLRYHEVLIFFLNWSLLYPFIYLFKRKGKDGKREVQLIIECAERCTNNALRSFDEKRKSTVGLHVPHYCVLLSFLSFIRHSVQKKSSRGHSSHMAFEQTELPECPVLRKQSRIVILQEYQDVSCYAVEVSSYYSLCQASLSTVWK